MRPMTKEKAQKTTVSGTHTHENDRNFHMQVQAGLHRAPRERAIAVRALWHAISKNLW